MTPPSLNEIPIETMNAAKALHPHVTGWKKNVPVFGTVREQVDAADRTKRDAFLKRGDLRLSEDLKIEGIPLTPHALHQVAKIARVPPGVLALAKISDGDYLADLARILNTELARWGRRSDTCLLRYRQVEQEARIIRSVFDHIPVRFDAPDAFDLLAARVPNVENAVCPQMITDGDTYRFSLFLPEEMTRVADSEYGRGLHLTLSEVGGGAQMRAYTFDSACLNGAIAYRNVLKLKIHHEGGNVDREATGEEMTRGIETLSLVGDDLLAKMGYTYPIPVPEPIKVIVYLSREHRLTEAQGRAWIQGYIEQTAGILKRPKNTAYSLLCGLNRGAQEMEQSDQRDEMETLVTRLLDAKDAVALRERFDRISEKAAELEQETTLPYLWISQ